MSYTATHQAILEWYQSKGRCDLPWRNTTDPYAIYLSEVMLQQTQVATVLARYYQPFLDQFPTFKELSNASQEKVLKAWEGLGYYSRARNLHKASIVAGGKVPDTMEGLLALPGIGKNTAHATLAFAYHQPVPVLEANVKRVLARFFAQEFPSDKQLWELAEELLDRENPFEYNQAMMDIGALVCTKDPQCDICPLQGQCQGKKTPERFVVKRPKVKQSLKHEYAVICMDKDKGIYLCLRDQELLGGMYGFPKANKEELKKFSMQKLGSVKHVYSHFKLTVDVYYSDDFWQHVDGQWINRQRFREIPLSGVDSKILKFANIAW
jgi:A/G-specific adenine glycosylase